MIKSKYIAKTLIKMISEKKDPGILSAQFLEFAKKNNLLSQLPNILYHLNYSKNMEERNSSLFLTSSHGVSEQTVSGLKKFVGASEVVKVTQSVDEKIIGGFIAKYKDIIYDASIKNQLNKLKTSLKN